MNAPQRLAPHDKDLGGGFMVRRILPAAARRSIGPFVFFDHFGPVMEAPGAEHDVRPHPHIGLATVTYLFEGAMMHRDSLGSVQEIRPGAINWMTAGRGIVHSERKPERLRDQHYPSHGLQLWAALPRAEEECEPSFAHVRADDLPMVEREGARVRVLVGEAFGARSPVKTLSPTLYLDVELDPGARVELPRLAAEMAVYAVAGDIAIDDRALPATTMEVLGPGAVTLSSASTSRLVVIGGEPLDGPRHITWNFVSSRRERILQAGRDWEAGRMGRVPGEQEFIPLPDRPFHELPPDTGTTPV